MTVSSARSTTGDRRWTTPTNLAMRGLAIAVAVCLAIDAYVHLSDATDYGSVRTSVLSQADLFRIQAVLAIVLAMALLVRPRRWVWAASALLLAGAAFAVVLCTYVDVGQLG